MVVMAVAVMVPVVMTMIMPMIVAVPMVVAMNAAVPMIVPLAGMVVAVVAQAVNSRRCRNAAVQQDSLRRLSPARGGMNR